MFIKKYFKFIFATNYNAITYFPLQIHQIKKKVKNENQYCILYIQGWANSVIQLKIENKLVCIGLMDSETDSGNFDRVIMILFQMFFELMKLKYVPCTVIKCLQKLFKVDESYEVSFTKLLKNSIQFFTFLLQVYNYYIISIYSSNKNT